MGPVTKLIRKYHFCKSYLKILNECLTSHGFNHVDFFTELSVLGLVQNFSERGFVDLVGVNVRLNR
jgi:hypothetical protein